MSEPRVRYEASAPEPPRPIERRMVQVVLPLEWVQVVYRLRQLHNLGYTQIRLHEVDHQIRADPAGEHRE